MGDDRFYPEEAPIMSVTVGDFWIDTTPVTNDQFAAFVAATGHVTFAEIAPDPKDYPGMDPAMAVAGSLVFRPPAVLRGLAEASQWWAWTPGADWRHPLGPDSSLKGLGDHPVVHVAHADALAYAHWSGKDLPTEAEWEYAARGGLDGAPYAWGDNFDPAMANIWVGEFPLQGGPGRTTPAGAYPANGFGLFDMVGNVWEWTADLYAPHRAGAPASPCCLAKDAAPGAARKVVKGGSHLCAPNYCRRYRPAARQSQTLDTTTSHIGFRCVTRAAVEP